MMTNLFSIFDPSSSFFSLSWLLAVFLAILIPVQIWLNKASQLNLIEKIAYVLFNEVSFTVKQAKKGELMMILMLFLMILSMNGIALFPQVFSLTSHLCVTLPLALLGWMTINLFGWLKNTSHMLAHLVPQGTPNLLMSFMVLIELTSSIIRPITLCVRLTANMIAGHLLMTLLGNSLIMLSGISAFFSVSIPLILTILETAVAFIQSYVFMTLITLYMTEVK